MAEVTVVGGGVGGLVVAIRLAAAGHRVTVLERSAVLGGKLDVRERDGFRFDTGPSLLTLPGIFDDVFRLAGSSLAAELELVRLDPQFRYRWPDGSTLQVHDDPERTAIAMEELSPGAGDAYRRFDAGGRRIWEVSERTFLAGPMAGPLTLARRLRSPRDLTAIDAGRTLATAARRCFADARLAQWAGRYATYSGSSPFRAPATLACIPHIEARYGAWYPLGGMGALRDALVRAVGRAGVATEVGAEVTAIEADERQVRAVRTAQGPRRASDIVVANVDAEHLYRDLLPEPRALARFRKAERSMSAFVVLAGVRGRTTGLAHHTVWFSADEALEFHELMEERHFAHDPTIYACVSAVTDPSQAPAGQENWFLLVNAPSGGRIDPASYLDLLLRRLARRGVDLRERLVFVETITPEDLEGRYRTSGGSVYGTSSNGRRAAFLRPGNRGPRKGLYLVGGSSHPGGGLPLVATSARIVAGLVREDGW